MARLSVRVTYKSFCIVCVCSVCQAAEAAQARLLAERDELKRGVVAAEHAQVELVRIGAAFYKKKQVLTNSVLPRS